MVASPAPAPRLLAKPSEMGANQRAPASAGQRRPAPRHLGVDVGERVVRVAHLAEPVGRDPGGVQHDRVPRAGPPVEEPAPRRGGGAGRGRPEQPQPGVLTQGHPAPDPGEQVGVGLAQPAQPGGQVAAVQAHPGALLHLVLVELGAQRDHLRAAPRVGVGVAGGGGAPVGAHADQRRRERVEGDPGDPAARRFAGQLGDDLRELVDDLVRVDLAGALAARAELVGDLAPPAVDRPARGVVDVAAAGRRADVQRQDERVERLVQPDPSQAPAHRTPLTTPPADRRRLPGAAADGPVEDSRRGLQRRLGDDREDAALAPPLGDLRPVVVLGHKCS